MRTQKRCLGCVAIVVDDYDRAIEYYTDKLGFTLVEDTPQPGKRWVIVSPNPESDCNILLARASNERQESFIGNQCGGRVFLFLQTDDFWRDYRAMKDKGVHFCEEPREEEYGTVVVFEDIYGNRWDLYQNAQRG
ncbi:TPA: VOC family protein [Enterobacter asburiae]|jgi:catechol 2,3-dioxygenase-like lactoylglutathione lyase family enzyme|uniref:VOC family protein n=1 Tax=Enterobacter asburiae TaxID=61645 RepID=UPI0007B3AE67|nr:VOC family protein [Enterobacter asburiae]KZR44924.1 glyoxalase [Enterobacter asburiae]MBL5924137.1 VOC family protein [Enterobacter asburiae]MBL5954925.1 VOC family protein [Enterobacter asburiae]MCM7686470.1 VOC family protein [Enterobacter asburiae]HDR2697087.1 VOC family protein [Enterobacter asburiae]